MKLKHAVFALAAMFGLAATGAQAQTAYPTRPITVIVPFAAGGPTDTVARLIAESMTRTLGQQVLVENVGGAGGTRGAGQVAKAAPDGYTLLIHHIGQATSASLYRKLPYNVLNDFEEGGLITAVPMTVIAKAGMEPKTAADLVDYIKKNKEKVTLGNAGVGSASHLCGMLLMSKVGAAMTTVPYQGTGPAMNDLVGGQIDLLCDQTTNTTGQIKAGKVKAYAVTTDGRVKSLGDIPTLKESGLPDFSVTVWHGLYAPKGTPADIMDKLNAALTTALEDPKVISRFADLGTEPEPKDRRSRAFHKQFLAAEVGKWKPIIEAAGVYAD